MVVRGEVSTWQEEVQIRLSDVQVMIWNARLLMNLFYISFDETEHFK